MARGGRPVGGGEPARPAFPPRIAPQCNHSGAAQRSCGPRSSRGTGHVAGPRGESGATRKGGGGGGGGDRGRGGRGAASAEQRAGRGRRLRVARIFPLEWVPAQWRAYARQQLATAALRCRSKKPTLGQNQKPARQQSVAEAMAARDRAEELIACPILFDSLGDARGAKRPAGVFYCSRACSSVLKMVSGSTSIG